MKKALYITIVLFFLTGAVFAMYGEDTEPSESDSGYMCDKESPSSVTLPETETEMPEAMRGIRGEQKENPDEDYIEDNVSESMRDSLKLD